MEFERANDYTDDELKKRQREAFRAHDLIASGYTPSKADLADAPIMHAWHTQQIDGGVILCGYAYGYPGKRMGTPVMSSFLIAIDEKAGWARSVSRYFRLGRPCEPGERFDDPPRSAPTPKNDDEPPPDDNGQSRGMGM